MPNRRGLQENHFSLQKLNQHFGHGNSPSALREGISTFAPTQICSLARPSGLIMGVFDFKWNLGNLGVSVRTCDTSSSPRSVPVQAVEC